MPQINRERWLELEPWLDQALELPPEARGQWLDELSVSSPDIAAELGTLLAREAAADRAGFLAQPADTGPVGMEVGAWTVDRSLGQGGMASVWLAHRTDGRYEGQAAVKFLNLALIGSIGAERFKREGSMLARLTHPGIARLLDAGLSSGQPYLILEYIDGQRIDDYVEAKKLSRDYIVRLFLQVLAAVEHAHANLIVHRDLKPSNILVTSDGTVKLLDFGIAKLLDAEETGARAPLTVDGGNAFTPAFAGPPVFHEGAADEWVLRRKAPEAPETGCHPGSGDRIAHGERRQRACAGETGARDRRNRFALRGTELPGGRG